MSRRALIASLLAPVLAVAPVAAGCGGPAGPSPSATADGAPAGSPSGVPVAPPAGVVEIGVTVSGGKVDPRPSVHKIHTGRTVRLTVTDDRDDEVHVHGYDLRLEVRHGKPATLEFKADQPGRFEVETHDSGLQLLQLEVS
ncbi:MAG TPA: hypothetical protein VF069_08710 [Streptosporangiaceae bacterium]